MERLTDMAQGYCEVYCDFWAKCTEEPENCQWKNEVNLYNRLREYEATGLEPEQIIRARDTLECFDNIGIKRGNAPLTYDELQQMKYEPVWIVWPDGRIKSRWWLVGRADWYMMGFDCRKDYGKVWIAYRKKEEETRNDVEN